MKSENIQINKKRAFVNSAIFLLIVLVIAIGSEIFTSKYISNQRKIISLSFKNKTMSAQAQKQGLENEVIYAKSIEKVMSEKEYQDFKNGLSIIAVNSEITINKISDGLVRNIKEYKENKIVIEAVGSYEAFKRFKDRLAKLNYFINFDKEIISRENAASNKIKINTEIHVIVLADKETKLLQLNKK
jgi:Tfp pilus assembly protein PilO